MPADSSGGFGGEPGFDLVTESDRDLSDPYWQKADLNALRRGEQDVTAPLVIYHANCPDGFTAAWVAARALGNVELYPAKYGDEPPLGKARDRDVYVLDFSYPLEDSKNLYGVSHSLQILDHHKTARDDLRELAAMAEGYPDLGVTFDMQRSGAGITWDHFHPGKPRPWIVDYVEDRDFWRFALPESRAVSLWIRCASHELEVWDDMARLSVDQVLAEARGCQRYLDRYVEAALREAYELTIYYRSQDLPYWIQAVAVNLAYPGVSDVLHAALEEHPEASMAIGWRVTAAGHLECSIRSRPSFDCSAMAKHFGGGGHPQASGFRLEPQAPLARHLVEHRR